MTAHLRKEHRTFCVMLLKHEDNVKCAYVICVGMLCSASQLELKFRKQSRIFFNIHRSYANEHRKAHSLQQPKYTDFVHFTEFEPWLAYMKGNQ